MCCRAAKPVGHAHALESMPYKEGSRHSAKFTHHIWRGAPLAAARESHAAARTQPSWKKEW